MQIRKAEKRALKLDDYLAEKTPVILESVGNATIVYFSDGSTFFTSYTSKIVREKTRLNFRKVNHKVSVNFESIECINKKGVKIMNKFFEFSRRKRVNWITALSLMFVIQVSYSQNTAPVAVNDTLHKCGDQFVYFTVINNDYDINYDKLVLHSFTQPERGMLASTTNLGNFRLLPKNSVDTLNFTYKIKDLRFGNIGSLTSNTANVRLYLSTPFIYSGNYATTNNRVYCRSTTNGTVTITGKETMQVYEYAEFLPGTTITATAGTYYEVKAIK